MFSSRLFQHIKTWVNDNIRYSRTIRNLAGLSYLGRGLLTACPLKKSKSYARAAELSEYPLLVLLVTSRLRRMIGAQYASTWLTHLRNFPRFRDLILKDSTLSRSIILKSPGPNGEKGVLMLTFEYNWVRLVLGTSKEELEWLERHFTLILSTSSSPTNYSALAAIISLTKNLVYVQPCNFGDINRLNQLHPRLRCMPCMPCDWLNPNLFHPLPFSQRDVDFLMVAFWGDVKRHFEFFQALTKMPSSLNVVLIGTRDEDRGVEWIQSLADAYGVPQKLEIHQSIPIDEVIAFQCRSKVSVILSRREGCCVAAVESMFGGSTLALRQGAHIGPMAYINAETGRTLRPGYIAEDLMDLLKKAESMNPSEWAVRELSFETTRRKVNQLLKQHAESQGEVWTQDIALPNWRPHPILALEEDKQRLKPCYDDLHHRFPKLFRADLMETSCR